MKNPTITILSVFRDDGKHWVTWEVIIPRERGQSMIRGKTEIGKLIEIEIAELSH